MTRSTVARPVFSRRLYELVADALDGVRAGFDEGGACVFAVECAAEALVALFSEDNPRFQPARFLRACGIE